MEWKGTNPVVKLDVDILAVLQLMDSAHCVTKKFSRRSNNLQQAA
jgi:hypothetical protein